MWSKFESVPVDKLLGGIFEQNPFSSARHIKGLIKNNKIKEALEELLRYYPKDDEVISLNAQWKKLQSEIGKKTISYENEQMTENQIRDAILSF